MEVLNTTSPTVWPTSFDAAPMEDPTKTVPSASAKMAGGWHRLRDKSTGFSEYVTGTPKLGSAVTLVKSVSSGFVREKLLLR